MDNQERFDKYVVNALNILHDEKVTPGIVQRMQSGDPVDAIGDVAVDIANRLDATAAEQGFEMTANTIINGMNVMVGELCEIAEAAGLEKLSDEQKYQAYSYALSRYLDEAVKMGKITPEELQQLRQGMEQQEQAEMQGQPMEQAPQRPAGTQQGQPVPQRKPGILGGM